MERDPRVGTWSEVMELEWLQQVWLVLCIVLQELGAKQIEVWCVLQVMLSRECQLGAGAI